MSAVPSARQAAALRESTDVIRRNESAAPAVSPFCNWESAAAKLGGPAPGDASAAAMAAPQRHRPKGNGLLKNRHSAVRIHRRYAQRRFAVLQILLEMLRYPSTFSRLTLRRSR